MSVLELVPQPFKEPQSSFGFACSFISHALAVVDMASSQLALPVDGGKQGRRDRSRGALPKW